MIERQYFLTLQGSIKLKEGESWAEFNEKLIKHIEKFTRMDNWCVQGSMRV